MSTMARSRATTCSSAPPGMPPSTSASSTPCSRAWASRRASPCRPPTSRACRCPRASGRFPVLSSRRKPMAQKSVVLTERAPAPFAGAPYSQAIRVGDLVFVSGQVPLKPGSPDLLGTTIREQTEQVFANLKAILEAGGSGLDRLGKTTVFLVNLDDFQRMNEVYARHVGELPPARSTVEVAKLPSGALVEIEAIALL